ncbi:DUF2061 domain-containing protein [Thalassotalea litorea]|uniref:DUF2061 domain-containing protein n=1 Tax=Thalassotalea litorea TaxID=2020715 RepID=UPI003736811A
MTKTLSFAITHFTVAFMVTYLLTGDLLLGSLVAIVEPLINTIAYHFHEKIWVRKSQLQLRGKLNETASGYERRYTTQPA